MKRTDEIRLADIAARHIHKPPQPEEGMEVVSAYADQAHEDIYFLFQKIESLQSAVGRLSVMAGILTDESIQDLHAEQMILDLTEAKKEAERSL